MIDFIIRLAPQVGLEPTTLRLTAECSAIELLRSVVAGGLFACPHWLYQMPFGQSKTCAHASAACTPTRQPSAHSASIQHNRNLICREIPLFSVRTRSHRRLAVIAPVDLRQYLRWQLAQVTRVK